MQLLDPVRAIPITAKAAEDALNAALRRQHAHIHGQPFQIKATSAKRQRKQVFKLRCAVCQHCTWFGKAIFDDAEHMLSSTYLANGAHGQPKVPKARSGPKGGC